MILALALCFALVAVLVADCIDVSTGGSHICLAARGLDL